MNLLQQHRTAPNPRSARPAPLVVVANRLPIAPNPAGGWRKADGGLVEALSGAIDAATTWLGWNPQDRVELPPSSDDDCVVHPVQLDRPTAYGYYDGFTNRTLWPLLHHLVHPAALDPRWWPAYRRANSVFAEETRRVYLAQLAQHGQAPTIWVHDYHLMLVPALLRQKRLRAPLAFSFHTPFPPPVILADLPGRAELLSGVLGADLVSFQTAGDLDNFARSCHQYLNAAATDGQLTTQAGKKVRLSVHPASIDVQAVSRQAQNHQIRALGYRLQSRYGGRRIILGVDRLDYTKGIPERIRAVETLAHHRPDLLESAVFVQVGVPTRPNVPEYRRFRHAVDEEVRRVNRALLPALGRNLIDYRYEHLDRQELIAHYLVTDVALVTALRDGMNLVAKEYVAVQAATSGSGALVLSRNTGAAAQLAGEAVLCDPFDPTGLADSIKHALELPVPDRKRRIAVMGDHITTHDAQQWAVQLLADLRHSVTLPGQLAPGQSRETPPR